LLKRAKDSKWCLPGGKIEQNETPLKAAKREVKEETGFENWLRTPKLYTEKSGFVTFVYVAPEFDVKINKESLDYGWFSLKELPEPLLNDDLREILK
jgi:8-oxo-dGTP pyrophosphatase MutT (NUDIX family)